MSKKILLFVSFLLLLSNSGCSVYMALNQQGTKNTELFQVGTLRSELIAKFGAPVLIGVTADGRRYEKFVFRKGYSSNVKNGRALLHVVADVLTYGLWEVVATPTERALGSSEVAYEVAYDNNGRVDQWAKVKTPSDLQNLRAGRTPRQQHRTEARRPVDSTPCLSSVKGGLLPYKNYRAGITPNQDRRRTPSTPNTLPKYGLTPYQMSRTGAEVKRQKISNPPTS